MSTIERTNEREVRGHDGNGILGQREDWASVAVDHRHASFLWQASRRQARRAARWWSDIFLATKQHIAGRDQQIGTRAQADRATSTLRGSSRKTQATFLHYDWLPRRVASCQSGCASPDRAQRRRTERSAAATPTAAVLRSDPQRNLNVQPTRPQINASNEIDRQGSSRCFCRWHFFIREADKAGYAPWLAALAQYFGHGRPTWAYCISECNFRYG
jgi:hypothetical protein